jgi:hypothetical protein
MPLPITPAPITPARRIGIVIERLHSSLRARKTARFDQAARAELGTDSCECSQRQHGRHRLAFIVEPAADRRTVKDGIDGAVSVRPFLRAAEARAAKGHPFVGNTW